MKKILVLTFTVATVITACNKGDTSVITPRPPAVTPTVSITASKSSIAPGETITITWSSSIQGAVISSIGGMSGTGGSFTISPTAPMTLTITATDRGKTGTAQTSIAMPDFDNLTAAPWKLWSIAGSVGGSNIWDSIVGNQIIACRLDDQNFFYPNKATKTTYGVNHCDPGETDLPGTWDFINGQLMWGHLFRYTVDQTRLVVEYTAPNGHLFRTTYIH